MEKLKKALIIPILAFAVFSLFHTSVVFADDVDMAISPDSIVINTTDTLSVDVTITNNQPVEDTFSLSIWPSTTWGGVTPNMERDSVKIGSGSEATIKLYMTASPNAEEISSTFLLTAKSTKSNISVSEDLNVKVRRRTDVYLSDLTLSKYVLDQGDCLVVSAMVTNNGFSVGNYRLQTVIEKGTVTIHRFDDTIDQIEGKSVETVSNRYCFDTYDFAGRYSVEATLKTNLNKFIDSRSDSFEIEEVSNLVFKKSVFYTPFMQSKKILVTNKGNVVEEDFNVTETVSDFISQFFYGIDDPTQVTKEDGSTVYRWQVKRLAPGESTEIRYEIRFTTIWISGIALAVIVFLAFSYAYRPRIKKSVRYIGSLKKGKEVMILLEIKNSTINEIKNISVIDHVSPIAKLIEKFDTITPKIKDSESGTSLMWKIKSLKPFEERVLTYRIKPKVDIIGSIRLPRAKMGFVNNKKEKKSVSSGPVEIK